MSESDLPDYVKVNRDHWTKNNAAYTDGRAEHAWNEQQISWGVWNTPESEINVLPEVRGKDVVELGCGTAYVSAWLKRRGARRVVGVDITPAQLDSARRLNTKYGLGLELVEANAEATGLPGASFDLAISEYGASIWCDPYKWIPEAARLLRPNGELVFLRNSTLSILCMPDHGKVQERLQRPQLGLNRLDWPTTPRPSSSSQLAISFASCVSRGSSCSTWSRYSRRPTPSTTPSMANICRWSGRRSGRPRRCGARESEARAKADSSVVAAATSGLPRPRADPSTRHPAIRAAGPWRGDSDAGIPRSRARLESRAKSSPRRRRAD